MFQTSSGGHGWLFFGHAHVVGCDKQRAGTPNHRHGVPALPLVTPYRCETSEPVCFRPFRLFTALPSSRATSAVQPV